MIAACAPVFAKLGSVPKTVEILGHVILNGVKNLAVVRGVRPFVTSFLRVTWERLFLSSCPMSCHTPLIEDETIQIHVILNGVKNLAVVRGVRLFVTSFLRVT